MNIDYVFFTLFSVNILIKFMTEFIPTGETVPCREIELIVRRYLSSGFFIDFIAWFPFHYMLDFEKTHNLKWLFIIKVIRILEAFEIFNVPKIMKFVRKLFEMRTQYLIKYHSD